jgi:hypothetical protein
MSQSKIYIHNVKPWLPPRLCKEKNQKKKKNISSVISFFFFLCKKSQFIISEKVNFLKLLSKKSNFLVCFNEKTKKEKTFPLKKSVEKRS